jgi:hypothetical protein
MLSKQNLPRALLGLALIPLLLFAGYWSGLFEKNATVAPEQAPAAAGNPEESKRINLKSAYLMPPIDQKFHRIFLFGELGGEGRVMLDTDSYPVDEFGEAPEKPHLRLARFTKVADQPTGGQRELYDIPGLPLRLRLVTPGSPRESYRLLVLDKNDTIRHVITLEPWEFGGMGAAAR